MERNFEIPRSARALILGAGIATGAVILTQAEIAQAAGCGGDFPATRDADCAPEGKGTTKVPPKSAPGAAPGAALRPAAEPAAAAASADSRSKTGTKLSDKSGDTATPAVKAARSPARRKSVEPEPAPPAPLAVPRFVKPFEPNTFFPEQPDAGRSMGEGNPRGFDMNPSAPLKLFVTGPTRIQLQLFPWVHADEAKRKASGSLKVTVTVNEHDKREIPPQPLPAGKIFPATKVTSGTDDIALWDNPLVLPWIDIPHGSHEVTVASGAYGFRVMPVGPQETSKSDVEPAIERPFEEDPTMPPRFRFACQLDQVAGTPAELALREITRSPLSGFAAKVQRFHDDTRAQVSLTLDGVQYDLARPLEQGTGHMCEFERTEPPVRSTDPTGLSELPLLLKPDGTVVDSVTGLEKPSTMQCRVYSKAAAVMCWETDMDSRVRAYRTRLDKRDTTPAGKGRRHILHKY